jgi:hypothetical protein
MCALALQFVLSDGPVGAEWAAWSLAVEEGPQVPGEFLEAPPTHTHLFPPATMTVPSIAQLWPLLASKTSEGPRVTGLWGLCSRVLLQECSRLKATTQ